MGIHLKRSCSNRIIPWGELSVCEICEFQFESYSVPMDIYLQCTDLHLMPQI